jgi:hypothetical protein
MPKPYADPRLPPHPFRRGVPPNPLPPIPSVGISASFVVPVDPGLYCLWAVIISLSLASPVIYSSFWDAHATQKPWTLLICLHQETLDLRLKSCFLVDFN